MVEELTEKEFKEKVFDTDSEKTLTEGNTFVDFYSSTCGPCKVFGKLVDSFSENYTNWKFYKVCVDDADDLMTYYRLRTMPTSVVYRDGEWKTYSGPMNAEKLNSVLSD